MPTYSFKYDFSEGCHPDILRALQKSNIVQQNGYGDDDYSNAARDAIKSHTGNPESTIYFVSGGTQANLISISAGLHNYEAVLSARSGHIYQHETGAIEATGHRVQIIDSIDGKISPEAIIKEAEAYFPPHTIKPKMVYLTQSTELGTIYQKSELEVIRKICDQYDMILYLDGARLGCALSSNASDMTLADIGNLLSKIELSGKFFIGVPVWTCQ